MKTPETKPTNLTRTELIKLLDVERQKNASLIKSIGDLQDKMKSIEVQMKELYNRIDTQSSINTPNITKILKKYVNGQFYVIPVKELSKLIVSK